MTKKALRSRRTIVTFEVKVMDDGEHLERLSRESTTGVVKLGKIAITTFDR